MLVKQRAQPAEHHDVERCADVPSQPFDVVVRNTRGERIEAARAIDVELGLELEERRREVDCRRRIVRADDDATDPTAVVFERHDVISPAAHAIDELALGAGLDALYRAHDLFESGTRAPERRQVRRELDRQRRVGEKLAHPRRTGERRRPKARQNSSRAVRCSGDR